MKQGLFAAIRGMNDILPKDAELWLHFETKITALMRAYGYKMIRTPLLEKTELFTHSIGVSSDIVGKEMYTLEDASESLTLRPEGTASIVRACVEHQLLREGPKRLWCFGPMFRRERPQRGRYRQFHQLSIEALGFAGPDIDLELILLSRRLFQTFNLQHELKLEINCIGSSEERHLYRQTLRDYFFSHREHLDEAEQHRLQTNPLRLLDSKNLAIQTLVQNAPRLHDGLGPESREYFAQLQDFLHEHDIAFTINPYLVRGLDYYNLTVFEWTTDQLGAQNAILGGGRYDNLVALLGGKPTPAVGLALGVERFFELLQSSSVTVDSAQEQLYLIHQNPNFALHLAEELRAKGLNIIYYCPAHKNAINFKTQMKQADLSGALAAIIIGPDEIATKTAQIKLLRQESEQIPVKLTELFQKINQIVLKKEIV